MDFAICNIETVYGHVFFLNVHNFQKSVFSNKPLLKGQKMIKKESNSIEINKVY